MEMVEELEATGRTADAACTELRNMIRDGAVTLLDFHEPPQTDNWLIEGALLILDAYRQMLSDFREKRRPAGAGALPYGYPEYFSDGVVALRAQFERAAGLGVSKREIIPSNRRFTSDERLVAEALEGIRSGRWPNAHKAAMALEDQAEGASSEAKVRRLGGKIRAAMN
jgi:hypothetical protein